MIYSPWKTDLISLFVFSLHNSVSRNVHQVRAYCWDWAWGVGACFWIGDWCGVRYTTESELIAETELEEWELVSESGIDVESDIPPSQSLLLRLGLRSRSLFLNPGLKRSWIYHRVRAYCWNWAWGVGACFWIGIDAEVNIPPSQSLLLRLGLRSGSLFLNRGLKRSWIYHRVRAYCWDWAWVGPCFWIRIDAEANTQPSQGLLLRLGLRSLSLLLRLSLRSRSLLLSWGLMLGRSLLPSQSLQLSRGFRSQSLMLSRGLRLSYY